MSALIELILEFLCAQVVELKLAGASVFFFPALCVVMCHICVL